MEEIKLVLGYERWLLNFFRTNSMGFLFVELGLFRLDFDDGPVLEIGDVIEFLGLGEGKGSIILCPKDEILDGIVKFSRDLE